MSVAAGPVGRSSEAAGTLANLAPIYSYSKSKGLFAGISLEGSVFITRGVFISIFNFNIKDANKKFYSRKVSAKEILTGAVEPPAIAEALYRALDNRFALPAGKSDYDNLDTPVSNSSLSSSTRKERYSTPLSNDYAAGSSSTNGRSQSADQNSYNPTSYSRPPSMPKVESNGAPPGRPPPPKSTHQESLPSYQQNGYNDQ